MNYQDVVAGGYVEGTASDAEFVEWLPKSKTLELVLVKTKKG